MNWPWHRSCARAPRTGFFLLYYTYKHASLTLCAVKSSVYEYVVIFNFNETAVFSEMNFFCCSHIHYTYVFTVLVYEKNNLKLVVVAIISLGECVCHARVNQTLIYNLFFFCFSLYVEWILILTQLWLRAQTNATENNNNVL